MKVILYFKFSIFCFLTAFVLFAYSLLRITYSRTLPEWYIKQAFFGLFATAIIVGIILDILHLIFKRTWYQDYQLTISLSIWSIAIAILAIIFGGRGNGFDWAVIFRLPGFVANIISPINNETMFIIVWIILSGIQGAAVGLVIDLVRKIIKPI